MDYVYTFLCRIVSTPNNRKYERKANRESWSHENMRGAVLEVLKGTMGYMKASKEFWVPQSTLEAGVKKKVAVRRTRLVGKVVFLNKSSRYLLGQSSILMKYLQENIALY
jgi:hypothetical protein